MAELLQSYPFTSEVTYDEHGDPIYDRPVDAEFLQKMFRKDRSYGVIMLNDSTAFQVVEGEGLSVNVSPGYCFARGCYGMTEEIKTVNFDEADTMYDRIDAVILKLNTNQAYRGIYLDVKKGEPAESPTNPSMNRAGGIWELGIANVRIRKNSTQVQQQDIEDTRYNPLRCGVSLPLQEFDTEGLYLQIQDQIAKNLALIQSALDDATAGYLQNQINAINSKIPDTATSTNKLMTKDSQYEEGSVVLRDDNVSPAALYGGNWLLLEEGRFIRSGNNSNTGGNSTHKHGSGSNRNGNLCAAVGSTDANQAVLGFRATNEVDVGVDGGTATYTIPGTGFYIGGRFNHFTKVYGETTESDYEPKYRNFRIWVKLAD